MPSLAPSPLIDRDRPQSAAPDPEERNPRALTEFHSTLDPYGNWVQHPTYGTVWVPSQSVVGNGFSPYVSDGHWALDEDSNWVWVSDYPFGGVVFHYGRWVWIGGSGWAWVPGYRYAPAWVHWRVPVGGYAYLGWAPMGPDYLWFNGYAVSYWYGGYTPWVFCPSAYVFHHSMNYYVVRDRVLVDRLAANTRRYVPATVGGGVARRSFAVSGPPLSAARVPAQAVPTQRLRAMPSAGPTARQNYVAPSGFGADRSRAAAGTRDSSRFAPAPSAERYQSSPDWGRRSAPSAERFRSTPAPSAPRATGGGWAPRSAPSSPAPRSFGGSSPRLGGGGGGSHFGGGSRSFGGGRGHR
jgi:hypothetical protein